MSDISDQRRYYERMMDEIAAERQEQFDQIKAENANLRELVEAMPYCMEGKCLACPLCSYFEPALGNVPECEALPMLHALGIYGDDEDKLGVTPF